MAMEARISYYSITDKGERRVNEDSLAGDVQGSDAFFVLCDGLGGHGDGDAASGFVVQEMMEAWADHMPIDQSILRAQNGLLRKQRIEKKESSMKTTFRKEQVQVADIRSQCATDVSQQRRY